MRAAPGCGLWFGDASTVAVRGVLSISVSAATHNQKSLG
jgi:hypothetical protein